MLLADVVVIVEVVGTAVGNEVVGVALVVPGVEKKSLQVFDR